MNIIERSGRFNQWHARLADKHAQARITLRIKRAAEGNFGITKPVGEGVHEMKIDYGPGYRVYYARKGKVTYLLLCGGDKSGQQVDIQTAIALWNALQKQCLTGPLKESR